MAKRGFLILVVLSIFFLTTLVGAQDSDSCPNIKGWWNGSGTIRQTTYLWNFIDEVWKEAIWSPETKPVKDAIIYQEGCNVKIYVYLSPVGTLSGPSIEGTISFSGEIEGEASGILYGPNFVKAVGTYSEGSEQDQIQLDATYVPNWNKDYWQAEGGGSVLLIRPHQKKLDVDVDIEGHFTDDPNSWVNSAVVPLKVKVSEGEDPVGGATVFVDGVSYGNTDPNGYLEIEYPIKIPIEGGQNTVMIKAELDEASGQSGPHTLYSFKKTYTHMTTIQTQSQARLFNTISSLQRFIDMPSVPGEPPWSSLLRFMMRKLVDNPYNAKARDVSNTEVIKFASPDIPPVWLVRETVTRDGQLIVENDAWTENENLIEEEKFPTPYATPMAFLMPQFTIYVELASPAFLYVEDPAGSHAGYSPSNGDLIAEFPIAISDKGDKPFKLFIPLPKKGEYFLSVVGNGTGEYNLSVQLLDFYTTPIINLSFRDNITKGEIHNYSIGLAKLEGDTNNDCKVDIFDLAAVGLAYGTTPSSENWNSNADLNDDDEVGILDLATVGLNYGRECK